MIGFGRLLRAEDECGAVTEPRTFTFTEASAYKALLTGTGQYQSIAAHESQRKIPVYYLLYNPCQIPSSAVLPLTGGEPAAARPPRVSRGLGA